MTPSQIEEARERLERLAANSEDDNPGLADAIRTVLSSPAPAPEGGEDFQVRAGMWVQACFGDVIACDVLERKDRFIEEALERVQAPDKGEATPYTADRAHALVDYVFGRSPGDPEQETGGVMMTLAALSGPTGIDMQKAGETELARVWTRVDQIRAKQAAKTSGSALPVATPPATETPGGGEPKRIWLQPACCAAHEPDGRRWSEDRWEECRCENPEPDVEYRLSTPTQVQPDAVSGEPVETAAKLIYTSWSQVPGYVPWVERGNSLRQDDARALARKLLAAAPSPPVSEATRNVIAERRRQVEVEGWTHAHDDEHGNGALAAAAACYAIKASRPPNDLRFGSGYPPPFWPGWATKWWKPRDRRSDLVRAAALTIAEIERLDRAALNTGGADAG